MATKGIIHIKENSKIVEYYPQTTYDSVIDEVGGNLKTDIDSLKSFKGTAGSKLETIATGATKTEASSTNGNVKINDTETTVYRHPSTSGNKHIPSGGSSGQILRWSADGTAVWGAEKDTTHTIATSSKDGLMSKTDKAKLDGIATGANQTVLNNTVTSTSTTEAATANAVKTAYDKANHAHDYLPLSGGTLTDNILYRMHGSKQTPMEVYGGDVNGQGISIGAGGATIISSGEGKDQIRSNLEATTEIMAIGSDQHIDFHTNLQKGWDNKKSMTMRTDGKLVNDNGFIGNITGNADTATKLGTARKINGVSFDGSADITTANWGTARTLTIGDTGKSVDGSANVSWSLSEIGASPTSHTHNAIVSRGDVTAESTTEKPAVAGMSMAQVYNNGYPTAFGNLISLSGDGHGQILVGWPGKNGVSSPVYVRSKRDVSDANWSDWAQFYTSANPQTNISGNAGTATKLQTARTITLGGDYSGSVSFDGSNNVTLTGYNYHCKISKGNTNNYPFSRIAHIEGTDSHIDKSITLLMSQGFQGGKFGIIKITLRSDSQNSTSGPWARVEAVWLVRSGYNVDEIQVGLVNKSNDWSADVFYKCTKPYESTIIKQIDSGGRGTVDRTWTLINSVESNNTTTTTNNTTECYTDISDYKTYSSIVTSYDAGTVQSANKLTNTRKINGVSFDGTSDITVADSTKLPTNGGTMYGDVIFSGIRRLKWDCGRSNQSEIFWNASSTKDLGVVHRVDGVDSMIVNSGNIHMKNPLKITNLDSEGGQIRLTHRDTGFIIRTDGHNTYFLVTEKGDPDGTWTSARPIIISGEDGECAINGVSVAREINSLKSSVVSGKQAVVDAINGKLGYASGLTTDHAFSDYNWWITHKIQSVPTINSTASSSARVNGYFPYLKDAISENRISQSQSITVDGAYILFVTYSNSEALYISPVSSTIKVYKNDGREEATVVDVGGKTSTDFVECFIINPQRTPITFTRQDYSSASLRNPAVRIMIQ